MLPSSISRLLPLLWLAAIPVLATGQEPEAHPLPRPGPAPLFPDPLPFDPGPLPAGLANASAQGCNACHHDAHDGWVHSAHATGHLRDTLQQAAQAANDPACLACHLPLAAQHPGTPELPTPGFDATLHLEGVTCVTCHVRDGAVVSSRPAARAPHPVVVDEALSSSAACAACHQLAWPGAEPIYDTFGEWQRSPYASAGVHCQDCHMGGGAAGRAPGSDHAFPADPARAVSLLIDLPSPHLRRGAEPTLVQIRLQNTGAGHAFPTGSPFKGVRLRAVLEGPPLRGAPREADVLVVDLQRTVQDAPPWRTLEDTRLPAAGERRLHWPVSLPPEAPSGPWAMVITLSRTRDGEVAGPPFLERRIPLRVE